MRLIFALLSAGFALLALQTEKPPAKTEGQSEESSTVDEDANDHPKP